MLFIICVDLSFYCQLKKQFKIALPLLSPSHSDIKEVK